MADKRLSFDEDGFLTLLRSLIGVDSTTGQYEDIQRLLCELLDSMGYSYKLLHKGGSSAARAIRSRWRRIMTISGFW